MSLFDQLQTTISTTLKVPTADITPDTRDEDIPSWDSLGQMNLIMALEQTFGITIEVEDFPQLSSVQAILAYLADNGVA